MGMDSEFQRILPMRSRKEYSLPSNIFAHQNRLGDLICRLERPMTEIIQRFSAGVDILSIMLIPYDRKKKFEEANIKIRVFRVQQLRILEKKYPDGLPLYEVVNLERSTSFKIYANCMKLIENAGFIEPQETEATDEELDIDFETTDNEPGNSKEKD